MSKTWRNLDIGVLVSFTIKSNVHILYSENVVRIKSNLAITLSNSQPEFEITFADRFHWMEIKKIVLDASFKWTKPSEWANVLFEENLFLVVECNNANHEITRRNVLLLAHVSPFHYEPVFNLNPSMHFPEKLESEEGKDPIFPMKCKFSIKSKKKASAFSMILVYDSSFV